ncbi:hypothetical protein SUDANB121_02843 [Nocardiopsis dassonvillei]|uniref:ABC transporter permease n=1 Tax=Nocardiopsis dassonvillei TaxID=2014 RepID=UPI003F546197
MSPAARALGVAAAELAKLRTLPVAVAAAAATVLAGAVLAAALGAYATGEGVPVSAAEAMVGAVPYVQAGLVLVGVLPVAHEYEGVQIRTTLTAVPDRALLLAGKTAAALAAVAVTAAATVGAGTAAAAAHPHGAEALLDGAEVRTVLGAAAYLTLIGLLAHAVALLLRHPVPALVGMLSLVLIASPLLGGLTEHARWLPDRAGALLYDPADTVLTGATGTLVLLGWTALVGCAGAVRFGRGDA